jgi:predicted amidohydrolase
VKAAVVQAAPILFDTSRTLEKLADLTHDASAQGADLVVFPEAFIGGYPKGLDFGARLGQSLKLVRWPRPNKEATSPCIRGPKTQLSTGQAT